jgi:hypothetical protein
MNRRLRKIELMNTTYEHLYAKHDLSFRSGLSEEEYESWAWAEFLEKSTPLDRFLENITKVEEHLSKEIDDYIVLFVAPDCRHLCDGIQQHLPREVRDMVYGYLLPPGTIQIKETYFLPTNSTDSTKPEIENVSHMIDLAFTNYLTRQELFESWYETNDFRFDDHCLIPRFLHQDLWGLDLPVRRLAKTLTINLWMISYTDIKDKPKPMAEQYHLLDSLLTIRPGAHFMFNIFWMFYYSEGERSDANADTLISRGEAVEEITVHLSHFFSPARRLLDAGNRISVHMWGAFWKDVSRDDLCRDVWYQSLCRWIQGRDARIR